MVKRSSRLIIRRWMRSTSTRVRMLFKKKIEEIEEKEGENLSRESEVNITNNIELHSTFALKFNECRRRKEYTDILINVGKRVFPVHRVVLQLMSPVLKNIISTLPCDHDAVCVLDERFVKEDIVEELLRFLYTSEVMLTTGNITFFCEASEFLKISSLSSRCSEFLINTLEINNAFDIYFISDEYEFRYLRQHCLEFIAKQPLDVFRSTDLSWFTPKNMKMLLLDLLETSASLSMEYDFETLIKQILFQAVIKWTSYDYSARLKLKTTFLRYIPFNELPLAFVKELISNENAIIENHPCEKFLLKALDKIVSLSEEEPLYFVSGETIGVFDCFRSKWREIMDLENVENFDRDNFGCASLGNKIYVCGGQNSNLVNSSKFHSFNCSTKTLTALKSLPQSRSNCAAAALNGFIYVTGGKVKESFFDSDLIVSANVIRYDPKHDRWQSLQKMNIARSHHILLEFDDYLYAIGGYDSTEMNSVLEIEKYNPSTDKWTIVTNYPGKLWCAVAHKAEIYVFSSERFQVYSPKTNQWRDLKPLKFKPLSSGKLLSMNGQLYAIFKIYGKLYYQAYRYDIFSDHWTLFPDLVVPYSDECLLFAVVRPEKKIIDDINEYPNVVKEVEETQELLIDFSD